MSDAVTQKFCDLYGEKTFEQICEKIYGDADHPHVVIEDMVTVNASNHDYYGYVQIGDDAVYFDISNGDNAGTVLNRFRSEPIEPEQHPGYMLVPNIDPTWTVEKLEGVKRRFEIMKKDPSFADLERSINYDFMVSPTVSIRGHYENLAKQRGLKIVLRDEGQQAANKKQKEEATMEDHNDGLELALAKWAEAVYGAEPVVNDRQLDLLTQHFLRSTSPEADVYLTEVSTPFVGSGDEGEGGFWAIRLSAHGRKRILDLQDSMTKLVEDNISGHWSLTGTDRKLAGTGGVDLNISLGLFYHAGTVLAHKDGYVFGKPYPTSKAKEREFVGPMSAEQMASLLQNIATAEMASRVEQEYLENDASPADTLMEAAKEAYRNSAPSFRM